MRAATEAQDGPFADLFDRHYPSVVRYAGRRVSPDAAADIASEVFVVAWRRRDEIPADGLPWLLGVARRVVANHRRGVVRHERLAERVAATTPSRDHHAGADVVAEQSAGLSAFAAAFARLSDDDRDVLALVAWEQQTLPQIAQVLGCSLPAATMRVHRARRRLRSLLDQNGETT